MWKDIRENVIHTGCPVSNYESCEKWKPCRIREKNRKWLYDTLCNNCQRLSSISFIRLNSSSRLILKSLFPKKKRTLPPKILIFKLFQTKNERRGNNKIPVRAMRMKFFPFYIFLNTTHFAAMMLSTRQVNTIWPLAVKRLKRGAYSKPWTRNAL